MHLHLFRHGEAVARDDPGIERDAERPLTKLGREQVREAAHGIRALGIEPDRVLASPYVRARQTGEVASEVLSPERTGELHELRPGADPADTRTALAGLDDGEDVLLCGHKPNLPKTASYLLTGDERGLDLAFGKASLVSIDIPLATPEALGRLVRHVPELALRSLGT